MTAEDLDTCYDRFQVSAFRLETQQQYIVPEEDADLELWLKGRPLPDRSVRTDPWLRRIAVTTAAGKHWSRVHIVDLPLVDYLRFEVAGYLENAAAGEEIRIALRNENPSLLDLREDFWLFDGGTPGAYGLALHYDADGRHLGNKLVTDPERLAAYQRVRDIAWEASMPLNDFTARGAGYWQG
ncbi:DUF6879 family protein [Nonomuraea guangzhouensis]|uniref:DUF6879 family protein n=1 Tax=Nonomuraea guangzhouensis TaxID=1291555 RepID=A0ABW4GY03_9ACTN|nr:DUF6879 family protein [Nonomuraea guangzhouensis]